MFDGIIVESLLKVLDRLIQLRKYKGERHVFVLKEIIEPSYKDLEAIHLDYLKSFLKLKVVVQDKYLHYLPEDYSPKDNDNKQEGVDRFFKPLHDFGCYHNNKELLGYEINLLKELYHVIVDIRVEYEPVRERFLSFVTIKDQESNNGLFPVEFKCFIDSLVDYFPKGEIVKRPVFCSFYSDLLYELDSYMENLYKNEHAIEEKPGKMLIRLAGVLDDHVEEIRDNWKNVSNEYNKLKLNVYKYG